MDGTFEVAEDEELGDIAAGNGLASKARPAGDGDAGDREPEKRLELRCLLGGLLEESHGWLDDVVPAVGVGFAVLLYSAVLPIA